MCVRDTFWRFIAFLLSDFDDTAVAAIKLVGQSRRSCAYFLCFFSATVQVDKSDSWYATNASVSYCETGGWTCSPRGSIPKTVPNTTSVGVWFTSSNMHLPYKNTVLQVPVVKTWQSRVPHLQLHLFFPIRCTSLSPAVLLQSTIFWWIFWWPLNKKKCLLAHTSQVWSMSVVPMSPSLLLVKLHSSQKNLDLLNKYEMGHAVTSSVHH